MVVKLSANTLSWSQEFAAGNLTLLDMIEECYNLRLDGVSPAQPHFASTDDEYLEEVKQAAVRRGLHMDYIGVSTNHAQLGEDRQANIDNLKKWIDVAAKMGIPMVRTFGGWLREGAEPSALLYPLLFADLRARCGSPEHSGHACPPSPDRRWCASVRACQATTRTKSSSAS
jgi:sugar phosphate isomerase/epimerase